MLHSWNLSPEEAIALQKQLALVVDLKPLPEKITSVVGADVGYRRGGRTGVAALAVYSFPSLELRELVKVEGRIVRVKE